ncbi:Carbon-nitrogen hydrolase [Penicillium angulare]|uniref:Carbon-nitrogen hydrolase n=1 Tax=Penicillium angulare TaxID=116970 RepID=A0A9W9FZJ2_9EURO|nr:Carbon-nitrogen hydrolase [Penicillium angulare]
MRIATLQFAPKLGDLEGNIRRANEILDRGKVLKAEFGGAVKSIAIETERLRPDVLVLPELALTGYNFPSLDAIKPHLEPAGTGPSAEWARQTAKRLGCKVCVGYPEIETNPNDDTEAPKYYNSLIVVNEDGEVIHNYRKCFLYFTDDTWAAEGNVERGFHELEFRSRDAQRKSGAATDLVGDIRRGDNLSGEENNVRAGTSAPSVQESGSEHKKVATSFGICMDINPYKFEAPYSAFEFASRIMDSRSQLVILSMAWLTMHSRDALAALNEDPDMDTFSYWLQRFMPLLEKEMQHARNLDDEHDVETTAAGSLNSKPKEKQVVIVFANRAGEEPAADDTKPPALYAGTSAVVAVTQRAGSGSREGAQAGAQMDVKILCWDQLGAQEEGICFADTTADPKMVFGLRSAE